MPKTQNIDQQIQARITEFVEELDGLVRAAAVEAVHEALGGAMTPRRASQAPRPSKAAKKTKSRKTGKKGKRIRRSSEEVEALAQDVGSHVSANPGQRLGEIAAALGMDTKDVRRPAFSLVEEGVLRTEGKRGGTRYFPAGGGSRKASRKKKTTKRKATRGKARKKTSSRKKTAAA